MSFGIFSYLVTIFVFAGLAVLIEYTLAYQKLRKYIRVIGIIVVIGLIFTLFAEGVALSWRIWFYSQDKTFGIYVGGAALETLIYTVLVAIAVASATLIWSDYEEDGKPLAKTTANQIVDKLQEWFRTAK